MPNTVCLGMSLGFVVVGVILALFPQAALRVSRALNRTLGVLDDQLVRHHRVLGLLLFVTGYGVFQLAMLLPTMAP